MPACPLPPCGGGLGRGVVGPFTDGPPPPTPLHKGEGGAPAQEDNQSPMASLKDMRVRIAATKATQKITKAMQMVAASKLRRAQAAAEAARPYAEHMGKVLGNIAASVSDIASAPRLLAGSGRDEVHLLIVCT